jgi:hypothetical protein
MTCSSDRQKPKDPASAVFAVIEGEAGDGHHLQAVARVRPAIRNPSLSFDGPDVGAAGVRPKVQGKIMISWLFRISVSIGLAGMVGGMAMGITRNFLLAPAHAHLILLGFVAMFLSALYYRSVAEAAASRLAPVQAVASVVGAILFPIGIASVRLGDRHVFMPVLVAGWLTVLTGMLLFVVIVYRSSAAPRATTEQSEEAGLKARIAGTTAHVQNM